MDKDEAYLQIISHSCHMRMMFQASRIEELKAMMHITMSPVELVHLTEQIHDAHVEAGVILGEYMKEAKKVLDSLENKATEDLNRREPFSIFKLFGAQS